MKRLLTSTLFAALLLTAAAAARAQNTAGPPPPPAPSGGPPATQLVPDRGRLEGGVYSNDFFGVSFTAPKGWVIHDAATVTALTDAGKKMGTEGAAAPAKQALDASLARTTVMLSATKYPVGTPPVSGFNAQLTCFAERVPTALVKTGKDYMDAMQRTYKGMSATVEMMGPPRTAQVGGVPMTVADVRMTLGSLTSAQRYYVRISKGYAVGFIYSYVDEADLKTFDAFLTTVKFK